MSRLKKVGLEARNAELLKWVMEDNARCDAEIPDLKVEIPD